MQIHIILQGKGGVGKTLIAYYMAQYFQNKDIKLTCIDTDPVNRSFSQYKALNVQPLELMEKNEINTRNFDKLIEDILSSENDTQTMIIDNGASSFVPFCSYMAQNQIIQILKDAGHEVIIHTVITGGPALLDTSHALEALCFSFPEVPIVLWLNEYFGSLEIKGKSFEDSKVYKKLSEADRISGIIKLPSLHKQTFLHDLEVMLAAKMTFAEAAESPDFFVMAKQRLKQTWRFLTTEMETAKL